MASRRALLLFIATSILLRAQSSAPDPQKLFDQVRRQVTAISRSAPNYTCVETIERSRLASTFQARGGCEASAFALLTGTYKTVEHDRLRLDVGVAENSEVFSWHGQHTFTTGDITKLVSGGAISSGSFFGFVADIFIGGRGHYFYHGISRIDGKPMAVFTYTMPKAVSHYVTRTSAGRQVVGFHGRFTADPETGDLFSLSVDTDDLPPDLRACSINQTVTYQNITLNGKAFRIPRQVELDSNLQDHERFKSVTRYNNCHEFVGESVIHYGPNPKLTLAGPVPTASLPALAPKLSLKVRLTTPIDSESAWTGDAVSGVVENTARGKHGRTLVPKGSTLSGRIVRLEAFGGDKPHWLIAIRFETVQTPDKAYRLLLDSKSAVLIAPRPHGLRHPHEFDVDEIERSSPPGTGQFLLPGEHFHLDDQFTTEWATIRAPAK